jgi:hypothetical protein
MWPHNNNPFAGNGPFPNNINQEEILFPSMPQFGHVPTTPQLQQGFPGMPQNFLAQNKAGFFENGNGEDHTSSNLDLSLFNFPAFLPNQVMSPTPQVSVAQHDLS